MPNNMFKKLNNSAIFNISLNIRTINNVLTCCFTGFLELNFAHYNYRAIQFGMMLNKF